MERVCENCAGEDDELAAVRRVYLTPESWNEPGSVRPQPDVELWCFSCRTQYPHETVESG